MTDDWSKYGDGGPSAPDPSPLPYYFTIAIGALCIVLAPWPWSLLLGGPLLILGLNGLYKRGDHV